MGFPFLRLGLHTRGIEVANTNGNGDDDLPGAALRLGGMLTRRTRLIQLMGDRRAIQRSEPGFRHLASWDARATRYTQDKWKPQQQFDHDFSLDIKA
jgi:hypothetical protein